MVTRCEVLPKKLGSYFLKQQLPIGVRHSCVMGESSSFLLIAYFVCGNEKEMISRLHSKVIKMHAFLTAASVDWTSFAWLRWNMSLGESTETKLSWYYSL